jgi:hypothetical protein
MSELAHLSGSAYPQGYPQQLLPCPQVIPRFSTACGKSCGFDLDTLFSGGPFTMGAKNHGAFLRMNEKIMGLFMKQDHSMLFP